MLSHAGDLSWSGARPRVGCGLLVIILAWLLALPSLVARGSTPIPTTTCDGYACPPSYADPNGGPYDVVIQGCEIFALEGNKVVCRYSFTDGNGASQTQSGQTQSFVTDVGSQSWSFTECFGGEGIAGMYCETTSFTVDVQGQVSARLGAVWFYLIGPTTPIDTTICDADGDPSDCPPPPYGPPGGGPYSVKFVLCEEFTFRGIDRIKCWYHFIDGAGELRAPSFSTPTRPEPSWSFTHCFGVDGVGIFCETVSFFVGGVSIVGWVYFYPI